MDASFLKYVSLFALLMQNCMVIILTRVIKQREAVVPFASSVAVLAAEALKFAVCALVLGAELPKEVRDAGSLAAVVRNTLVDHGWSTLKCCVPALCYTAQNNLIYFALGRLEIVVFQLLYQTKLLLTAALSVCILGKRLGWQQWSSLALLFAGVVIVQLSGGKPGAGGGGGPAALDAAAHAQGVVAAVVGSTLSAFAGVYFEWLLKEDMKVSLWARNLQLCLFTLPMSAATVYSSDADAVAAHGLLGGFDRMVWAVVLTQAFGGLIVAMCMKYADNIMKNFASSGAIILGGAASVVLFNFEITPQFALGAGVVVGSMLLYDPNLCDCRPADADGKAARAQFSIEDGDEDAALLAAGSSFSVDSRPSTPEAPASAGRLPARPLVKR
jgi:UDP-sugar transporter A1/2/3